MLTRRGIGFIVIAGVLWVAARSFGVAELQMVAVAALLLVATSLGFTILAPVRLAVDRIVRPATLFYDTEALVELRVTNSGRLPTMSLELGDRTPSGLAGPPTTRLPPIAPGRQVTVTYRLRGTRRGRFTIGPAEITLLDPFGLTRRRRLLPDSSTMTVYPPVWRLPPGVPLGGASASGRSGRRRPAANGEDFAKVREYVRGDDLRAVHWATTAHRGRLMVRQGESAQEPRAVVLLDIRASRHAGTGSAASIEAAVAAAASAGFHLAKRGRSLVLVDRPLAVPPMALPWEAWLERLADTVTEEIEFGDVLRQLARGVAGDGALVAITTVPDPAELRQLVRAGRNFATPLALLVDTTTYGPSTAAVGDEAAKSAVAALRSAGWRVGLLTRGTRIDVAWQELLLAKRAVTTAASAADV